MEPKRRFTFMQVGLVFDHSFALNLILLYQFCAIGREVREKEYTHADHGNSLEWQLAMSPTFSEASLR